MEVIKIPQIANNQIISGNDWALMLSLPDVIMKTLVKAALYQEFGHATTFVTSGFEFQNYSPDRYSITLGPGIAVLDDIVISSESESGHYITLEKKPDDGDILVIGWSLATGTQKPTTKMIVNDLTEQGSIRDVLEEKQGTVYAVRKYIPKFRIAKKDELIDSRYEISHLAYLESIDNFSPILNSQVSLQSHRSALSIDHVDGSIVAEKLSPSITGRQTGETASDSIKDISESIFGLMGKLPGILRISRHITNRGEWVISTPGYWGIDDIVYAVATELVQKGRDRSVVGGNVNWQDLQYDSPYTPSIGWVNPADGMIYLNPAAFFHISPGARYAVRVGTTSISPTWISAILDGSNSRPLVNPPFGFPLEKIYYFTSMKYGIVRVWDFPEEEGGKAEEDLNTSYQNGSSLITCHISPRAAGQSGHSPGGNGTNEFYLNTMIIHTRYGVAYDWLGESNYLLIGVL